MQDGTSTALSTVLGPLSFLPKKIMPMFMKTSAQGAYVSIFAATHPIVREKYADYNGGYFHVAKGKGASWKVGTEEQTELARDQERGKRLEEGIRSWVKELEGIEF
jgi:hypothetical protein